MVVDPADVMHATRCAVAWHFHQADPARDDTSGAERRLGALLAKDRRRKDPTIGLWMPLLVLTAAVAAVTAQFLLAERNVAGYVIIATALVLLQSSAALLTLHLMEERRRRRVQEVLEVLPHELDGAYPTQLGPVNDTEWGLEGRVGTVVHGGERPVPAISAPGRGKRDVDPWLALRVGASMRLLEVRDGKAPDHGLVVYEDGAFRVAYADVRGPLRLVVHGLQAGAPPSTRDHNDRRRCNTCPWLVGCSQALR